MENSAEIYRIFGGNLPARTYACASSCLRMGSLFLAFTLLFPSLPACAADDDPFQLDEGQWMSFGHYKDADKRGLLDKIHPPPAPEVPPPPPVAAAPVIATPSRPVDLPVLPGLNKGFAVEVNSTEEHHQMSSQDWQTPALAVQTYKLRENGKDNENPLGVRLSFLPNQKITPIPSPERASSQKLGHEMLEKSKAEKKTAKSAEDAAVCAAIDAYKKQQLDAIQSDRQTLKALQDATNSLGLQKQLGFMAGNSSVLTNAPNTPIPTNIDVPASTSVK